MAGISLSELPGWNSLHSSMTLASGFHGTFDPAGRRNRQGLVGAQLQIPPADSKLVQGGPWNPHGQDECWFKHGSVSLACHGEIHSAAELCQQLALAPDSPQVEMLVAAWQRWSFDFLPRLDGVFALALHFGDELLLYRDPSGLSNLYFHTGVGARITFATHLETLLGLPGVPRRLSRRSLHEYLRFLDTAAPHTMFEGMRAVEPGQLLRCSARGIEEHAWPDPAVAAASPVEFGDAVAMLDEHLQRSLRVRLSNTSRPAAFLSGGIDSALLCAGAARQRADLTAVTVDFESTRHDETPIARRIAARLGISHEVVRFGRANYLATFDRLSEHLEQPMADPATAATLLAFEHCRDRYDMVLDGTGADEAVGAMPPRHVRLAVEYASLLPVGLRLALTRVLHAVPALAGYAPILDFEHPADTMIRWRGFTRQEIEALCGEPVSFADTQFYRTFARFPRGAHFERYSALLDAMPSDRLTQAALISGMRVRYPFFDTQTNRFLRHLRPDYRYLTGQPKRILRALLARYVPREIWDVPKHGFNFPLHEFLAADDFALVRRHLDQDLWRQARILSVDRVQHYARQFIAGDRQLTFRVWALVMLGAWLAKHDELL